jgi:metal-responsive CopG/Arc/MetJ family transcriptional regulator
MASLLISLPDELLARLKAAVPPRRRSQLIARLVEAELGHRDDELYRSALAVEMDKGLNAEMADWDATIADGLED